jgi:hypothetical protein
MADKAKKIRVPFWNPYHEKILERQIKKKSSHIPHPSPPRSEKGNKTHADVLERTSLIKHTSVFFVL